MDTRETITLDARAQQRLMVLDQVLAGALSVDEASRYLQLSTRQVQRLLARYASPEGAAALVHGNHGRVPANRVAAETRARIVELARTTYAGFNPVHLAEALAEDAALPVGVSARTVRRVLGAAGIALARTRRPARHRSRRERMPRVGMLLQVDGSREDWLEGRGPWLTLIAGIDDASSGVTSGTFRAQEDAHGYLTLLTDTARRHGLPLACYSDLHGIFRTDPNRAPTLTEQLTGQRSLTHVGRALEDAGIGWIGARSPQAKGRIERLWGTLQDRLVSELRRARVATMDEANGLLAWYLPRHNARFAVEPRDAVPAWRPWPEGDAIESVFCFRYRRRVAPDATVAWAGASLALPRTPSGRSWAGRMVTVQERLDGSLWVADGGTQLRLVEAPATAPVLRARQMARPGPGGVETATDPVRPNPGERPPSVASVSPTPRPHKPAPDHPWRR